MSEQNCLSFPWGTRSPINAYRDYILRRHGERVQRISVNAGMSCPNRDGTLGRGGCLYCNHEAFTPAYLDHIPELETQIEKGREFLTRRYGVKKFYVYFQPFSNTHAPVDKLEALYQRALNAANVVGLVIGTRPDCVDEVKLELIARLARDKDIVVEYGAESTHDQTLEAMHRGHTYARFQQAVRLTHEYGIKVGAHIILGLPGESPAMMLDSAATLSSEPITFLKIHHLHIVQGTPLAARHRRQSIPLFSTEQYIPFVAEFLRRIHPQMVIQRLVGETNPHRLIAPDWGKRAQQVTEEILAYMARQGYYQGQLWQPHDV